VRSAAPCDALYEMPKSGNLFTVTVTKTERLATTEDVVCIHKRCKRVDIAPGLQTRGARRRHVDDQARGHLPEIRHEDCLHCRTPASRHRRSKPAGLIRKAPQKRGNNVGLSNTDRRKRRRGRGLGADCCRVHLKLHRAIKQQQIRTSIIAPHFVRRSALLADDDDGRRFPPVRRIIDMGR
jgi:hypothetical protein